MPNYNPVDIANEFIRLEGARGVPSQMKLQKLVFIANGWNVAISGDPLVNEEPEAWDKGPVFRIIWDAIREWGYDALTKEIRFGSRARRRPLFSPTEQNIIQSVWERYGHHTGLELSKLTHLPGTPWTNAYFNEGRNSYISHRSVGDYYADLAAAADA